MKKLLLIVGLLLVTYSSFSQCWVEDLKNDLYAKEARENGFLDFFETDNLKKKEAYKILHTEANDLKNNIEELSLVSKNLDEIKGVGGYVKWKEQFDFFNRLNTQLKGKFKTLTSSQKTKFVSDFKDLDELALIDLANENVFKGWLNHRDEIANLRYEIYSNKDLNSIESTVQGNAHLEKLYEAVRNADEPSQTEMVQVAVKHKNHEHLIEVKTNYKPGEGADNKVSLEERVSPKKGTLFDDFYSGKTDNSIHPIFKQKADYINFLRRHYNKRLNDNRENFLKLIDKRIVNSISNKSEFSAKIHNANFAGAHGEIRSLSALLFKLEKEMGFARGTFPRSRLGEIDMIVRTRKGKIMQRCPCCFYLTQGVNVIGSK